MFNEKDLRQLQDKGIKPETINEQIKTFEKGIPFIKLDAPATPDNGLKVFEKDEGDALVAFFDKAVSRYNLLKFVPASGAASRMFKDVFALRDELIANPSNPQLLKKAEKFLELLPCYAFFKELQKAIENDDIDYEQLVKTKDFVCLSEYLLFEKGLNYAATPKALIKFHKYNEVGRTSLEEHLVEGARYCKDSNNIVNLHFTISPEHKERVTKLIDEVKNEYEKIYNITYNITYSVQKPATDTIAVDMDNKPFREKDGSLLFRPAGHGALIQNLNECSEDIIFIKNIDNVVPDRLKEETVRYKKIIGGLLMQLKEKIDGYLNLMETPDCSIEILKTISTFAEKELYIKRASEMNEPKDDLQKYLYEKLNRPIRICGMVKNEGEPGGGPFWVINPKNAELSLQIVEASQINLNEASQKNIVGSATHFNPVDLVCSIKNYKGKKFNLLDFIDNDTGFISVKSKDGKDLKALELPGLWNGAMADWITVFVEVPIITFNPVKTIEDLLRKEHIN